MKKAFPSFQPLSLFILIVWIISIFSSFNAMALRPFPAGLPICLESDFRELEKIYDNTNGDNWTNHTNWFTSPNMASWYGITLTASGCDVQHIYLSSNNLVGTLPVLSFPELISFKGWFNSLSGTLPAFDMPKLTDFNFQGQNSNAGFTGPIPNFNMPFLKTLHLWGNKFSGSIPNFNMPVLEQMWLDNNQLSGSIPNFNMSLLKSLHLLGNALSGSIPNFNMPVLEEMWLQSNQLTGSIPNFNMPLLKKLELWGNALSGSIPNFNMPSLETLWLSNNQLSGTIPNLSLPELSEFNFANNQLSGAIPNMSLPKLKIFRVSYNQLSSTLPNFTGMPLVDHFYAPFNQISGSIPSFSGMSNLKLLSLSGNQLSGAVPDFNLLSLDTFFVRDNSLSGNIPNLASTSLASANGLFYFFGNGFVFGNMLGKPWLNTGDVIYAPQDSMPILFDGTTLSVNTGAPNSDQQFTWYKDGAVVAVNQSNTYVPASNGIYKCTATHNTLTVPANPNKNLVLNSVQITVSALPIELLRFDVILKGENDALLTWQTATEVNNQGYDVEMAINDGAFRKVGYVLGKGTSNSLSNYEFLLFNISRELHYFRLKIKDVNGGFTYSPVRVLQLGNSKDIISVYPNPTLDGILQITLVQSDAEQIQAELINSVGQLVSTTQFFNDGSIMHLQLPASGIYHLVMHLDNGTVVTKRVVRLE